MHIRAVDDFKLVGRRASPKQGWDLMRTAGLVLDPPTPLGDYLGCGQTNIDIPPEEAQQRLQHVLPLLKEAGTTSASTKFGQPVRGVRYMMDGFFEQVLGSIAS